MPSSVSKLEPAVVTVVAPEAGAVQRYQTEAPPEFPASGGSPGSFVAPRFEPATVPLPPLIVCALANVSFAGPLGPCGAAVTVSATLVLCDEVAPVPVTVSV